MIRSLSSAERQTGLFLAIVLAFVGLTMAAAARQGPMAIHGAMALVLALFLIVALAGTNEPLPPVDREQAIMTSRPVSAS